MIHRLSEPTDQTTGLKKGQVFRLDRDRYRRLERLGPFDKAWLSLVAVGADGGGEDKVPSDVVCSRTLTLTTHLTPQPLPPPQTNTQKTARRGAHRAGAAGARARAGAVQVAAHARLERGRLFGGPELAGAEPGMGWVGGWISGCVGMGGWMDVVGLWGWMWGCGCGCGCVSRWGDGVGCLVDRPVG